MAGAAVRIRGDDARVKRLLKKLQRTATQRYRAEMNHTMGAVAVGLVQECFRNSRDPYGRPYAPLQSRDGVPLRDTNRLMNSVNPRATSASFTISTNVIYAAVHNFGAVIRARNAPYLVFRVGGARPRTSGAFVRTKEVTIPKRAFLPDAGRGLSQAWRNALFDAARAHTREALHGAR